MMRPAALLALMLLVAVPARADWVAGRGERIFGPEISEADACRAAEERAREAALKARVGERMASEDLLVCTEKGDDADCSLNRSVWNAVDGDIRAIRDRTTETHDGPLAGFRACTVALEADIAQPIGVSDPSFDMAVTLGARIFRDGEDLTLEIQPTQPMHVAVFQWQPAPNATSPTPVARIFPSRWDSDDYFPANGSIPTTTGRQRYSFRVSFPTGLPADKRVVGEYLLIIATRNRVDFRDSYALDEFKGRLLEIPRPDSRLVKRAYTVVRDE